MPCYLSHLSLEHTLWHRELRQVLTDILPGGSESPSISERTSTDSRARSSRSLDLSHRPSFETAPARVEASRAEDEPGQEVASTSQEFCVEPPSINAPELEASEGEDRFDQDSLNADREDALRDYRRVAAGLAPYRALSGKKVNKFIMPAR